MINTFQIVIGTAGHIDHGKTSIVKALTGTDTDVLLEEKKRGMTIDIGFAYLNKKITIIDVPGHEKFIRNMVAGVSTINIALIIVAADDGLMPQTHEHIEILNLLNIKHAIIALSKVDKVDKSELSIIEDQIRQRIKDTNFQNAKIIKTSVKNDTGLDILKNEILHLSKNIQKGQDRGMFYMPVDRVFSKKGFGTIVTGTVLSGRLEKNSEIDVFPGHDIGIVRSLQTHGKETNLIKMGDRAAVNISNMEHSLLKRGSVLIEKDRIGPTSKIIAYIKMMNIENWKIVDKQLVHIHIGTSRVIAKAITYGIEVLPGQSANILFDLDQQITPMCDQRLIIRSISPMVTIAGGKILDNNPKYRKKELKKNIQKIEVDSSKRFAQALVRNWRKPLSIINWSKIFNVSQRQIQKWMKDYGVVESDRLIFSSDNLEISKKEIFRNLSKFHKSNKFKKSISKDELLHQVNFAKKWFEYVVSNMKSDVVENEGGLSLKSNEIILSNEDALIAKNIENILNKAGFSLLTSINVHENQKKALNLLYFLKKEGVAIQVDSDLWMHLNSYKILKNKLSLHFNRNAKLSVPELKETISVTRKNAIPILEFCDKIKLTKRIDNYRIRGDYLNE